MKKRCVLLTIISILFLLIVSCASVSAQEIDIENMNDAELLALVQVIMQKLQEEESADSIAEEPGQTSPAISSAEPEPDAVGFKVYGNKKISMEPLPDYMFIQKPTEKDKSDEGSERHSDNYKDEFIALIEKYGETLVGELDYYKNEVDFISEDEYNAAVNFYNR